MEKIKSYFTSHPEFFGFVFIGIGILLIVGVICNWDWILEGDGRVFNIAWFSNVFGRTAARIIYGILGLLFILIGLIWFVLYSGF